ncbi:DUF4760 domain-containing protein [Microbispora sp. CA-102843]|uniref:DUF4760 domain-containing protein n=1 Tax=Microbispora sp. CA-102843 TaxID=3239952 RepID=UPI003D8F871C
MDPSDITALAVSLLALVVSVFTALRQTTMMRHSNQLPVLVELFQEFRSTEWQRAEAYALGRLQAEHDPDIGCSGLPDEARIAVNKVVGYYSGFGYFVYRKMADESLVVPLIGYRASRAWDAVEPFVRREREIRGSDDRYASMFEDFVRRVRAHMPLHTSYGLRLKTLPVTLNQVGVEEKPQMP